MLNWLIGFNLLAAMHYLKPHTTAGDWDLNIEQILSQKYTHSHENKKTNQIMHH